VKSYRSWLDIQAAVNPDGSAVRTGSDRITFRELSERADIRAAQCAAFGIAAGTNVGLLTSVSVETVLVLHALIKTGAVIVPLNARLDETELREQITFADCTHCIIDTNAEAIGGLPGDIRAITIADLHDTGVPEEMNPVTIDMDATLAMIFTSGTSGLRKAVELSYSNFLYSAIGTLLRLDIRPDDSWLLSLPVYHIGGFAIPVRTMLYGIPVIVPRSLSTEAIGTSIREDDPSILSLVPTMMKRLIDAGVRPNRSHRVLLLGGGPVDQESVTKWRDAGWKIAPTYGATETCSQVATLRPEEASTTLSAGMPLPFNRIRITDDKGSTLPPNETGTIEVSSPAVMKGYYKQRELSDSVVRDGWYRTGDFGRVDERGNLYIDSRRTDLIVSGGENVNPVEVEIALHGHPGVEDVCVFPYPDPEWGQIVAAAIVFRSRPSNFGEIKKFLSGRLASYKIPKKLYPLESIPYTEHGKINRREILGLIGQIEPLL
jgi:o-succinylbenzoate---CoA ligase